MLRIRSITQREPARCSHPHGTSRRGNGFRIRAPSAHGFQFSVFSWIVSVVGAAEKKYTIALIPGLTTDPFYITMHKGAEEAAKVLGVDLVFQGAPDFNPVTQVPVLNAIIGRKPDAILIAPTDKNQLVQPLKKAVEAGILVYNSR